MGSGATVTADINAGRVVTSLVLTNMTELKYDFIAQTAQIVCDQGRPIFDIKDQTTFTLTVSGVTYTLTIS